MFAGLITADNTSLFYRGCKTYLAYNRLVTVENKRYYL